MEITNRIENANIYVGGSTLVGTAEEMSVPEISFTFTEHCPLGVVGTHAYVNGIEKLEGSIKWSSLNVQSLVAANSFTAPVQFTVHYPVAAHALGGTLITLGGVITMDATLHSIPLTSFKKDGNLFYVSKYTANNFKQVVDGKILAEINAANNVFILDGVEVWDIP